MCTFLSEETHKARKQHSCSWCGQKIEPGEMYVRQRLIFEDAPTTNKFHPECDASSQVVARQEGGCFEFNPGENERPAATK